MTRTANVSAWETWDKYRADEMPLIDLSGGGDIPTALFYPADYSVGMTNLGMHYIYRSLRECGIAVERFFASPIAYRSVESDSKLENFSNIMASVSFEEDIPVLMQWLTEGGVSLSRDRREVIGAGGAITYINPLALAGFCDYIVLGDGVSCVEHIASALRIFFRDGDRHAMWERLAENDAIFVPELHLGAQAKRRVHRDEKIGGASNWITDRTVFGDALLVEVQRGCKRGCPYCTLPSCFAPLREADFSQVREEVIDASKRARFSKVGLVTPEAGDYSRINELLDFLGERNVGVSFASLRIDGLTASMIAAIVRSERRSVTIAPETGSDRLRTRCGKGFTNDYIVDVLSRIRKAGIAQVKLYFMIGLPGERDEDVIAIAHLCNRIRSETRMTLSMSVNVFIPKPMTAWESESIIGEGEARKKFSLISSNLDSQTKRSAAIRFAGYRASYREYALSWCDSESGRKLAGAIERGAKLRFGEPDRKKTTEELALLGLRDRK